MIFSEGNREILAADASDEEKAAQMDPTDQRMIELSAEKIEKSAIDSLITDLEGERLFQERK